MPTVLFILLGLAGAPQGGSAAKPPSPAKQPAAAQEKAAIPDFRPAAPHRGSLIFECDFGSFADRDGDGWPDGWTRRRGKGFHDFLKMGIAEDLTDADRNSILRMEMNGGSAAVTSPSVTATPNFSYVLEGELRMTDLVHDDVLVTLNFLDAEGKALDSKAKTLFSASRQWEEFRLGPFIPVNQTLAANFSLQVVPRDKRQDLRGQAAFRNLRLQRLPRMALRTPSAGNIFLSKEQVEVHCEIAGIPQEKTSLLFELFDHEEHCLAAHPEELVTGADDMARASWKPFIPSHGFYRVKVSWRGNEQDTLDRSTTLAIIHPYQLPKKGEFGWTLPPGEEPLGLSPLSTLLSHAGIHWAKYPVSFRDADSSAADRIAWFAERLSLQGIEMVGVLDRPPGSGEAPPIASVLEDAEIWKPWVDPIMTRLSLKVRYWQLGEDRDFSLVGYPRLGEKIREVQKHLERFGQEVKLGAGWRWLNQAPAPDVSLAMLNYTGDPPLTAEELEAYLKGPESKPPGSQRWVVLQVLPREEYSMLTRAHDLVMRMLTAKIAGADAILLARPFDAQSGLMNDDGSPGELFIPWRTTAAAVTGAQYLGEAQLPGGSINRVFVRDGQAVMAVWNDKTTVETMYFGEDVRQFDIWGRESVPETIVEEGQTKHRIKVGPQPTFVAGLNEMIARWKMAVAFESTHIESIFAREQTIYLRLKNFFPQGVSGELRVNAPESWKKHDTQAYRLKLGAGEEIRLPLRITLPAEASSGPQPLRLDFSLSADRNYQFSVHRTLQLGLDDVTIQMTSRLRDDGMLEVTQQLTNLTDKPLSFQCVLFPPGRRRETRLVIGSPSGPSAMMFLLPSGEELVGKKLVLRAEEIGGARVLNYSMTAEK